MRALSIKAVTAYVTIIEVASTTLGYDAPSIAAWARSKDPTGMYIHMSGSTSFSPQNEDLALRSTAP